MEIFSINMLCVLKVVQDDGASAHRLCEKVVEITSRTVMPDTYYLGAHYPTLISHGMVAWRQGRIAEAKDFFETLLHFFRKDVERRGNPAVLREKIQAILRYCPILEQVGEYTELQRQALEAVQLYRQVGYICEAGDPLVEPLGWLGQAEMYLGDFTAARPHLLQFIQDCLVAEYPDWALFGLYHFAELLVMEEDSAERRKQALALLTLVLNHPRLEGVDYHPAIFGKPALPTITATAAQIEKGLTAEEAAAARERGRQLALEEVVEKIRAGW